MNKQNMQKFSFRRWVCLYQGTPSAGRTAANSCPTAAACSSRNPILSKVFSGVGKKVRYSDYRNWSYSFEVKKRLSCFGRYEIAVFLLEFSKAGFVRMLWELAESGAEIMSAFISDTWQPNVAASTRLPSTPIPGVTFNSQNACYVGFQSGSLPPSRKLL